MADGAGAGAGSGSSGGQPPPQKLDLKPFPAYHFTVEIDGENISYPFRSCSGLKIETAMIDLEEGGFNTTTRKLIGRTKYPNLVLKRGFCSVASELYKLKMRFMNDLPSGQTSGPPGWVTVGRINGLVTQKGARGSYAKWRFIRGIVCKWEGPDLDATKNECSIESIEIAHEGIALVAMKGEE